MKRPCRSCWPAPAWPCGRRSHGFTLIELMVTIALMAIVLGLAAPSFVTFQRNSELTATANSFVAAVTAARAEAMKRQLDAYVVPCNTPTTCSFADDWANGWRVFVSASSAAPDPNVAVCNGNPTPGTPCNIIISQHEATTNVVPTGLLDGSSRYVGFSGSGFLKKKDGSFGVTGVLKVKHSLTGEERWVILNPSGRVHVCKPPDAGCSDIETFT